MMQKIAWLANSRRKIMNCGLVVIVLLCVALGAMLYNDHIRMIVVIGDNEYIVNVADQFEQRQKGLSGQRSLCDTCGMYFVFDEVGIYQFWMKEMLFDIDVVWIRNGVVVDMQEHVSFLGGEREIFSAGTPVDHVVELPAGTIARDRIDIGQAVKEKRSIFE